MSIYLLDKQKGITSNKALSLLKREINVKKAGFSGVLDPFATGLLIVATNGDTRFLDLFLRSRKKYSGTILFGKTTDSLDTDGEVVEEIFDFKIDENKLKELIKNKFTGKIKQTPPKYSNIKVDGKRAHELSRNNVEFELKSVDREVYSFEVQKVSDNEYDFIVEVSSGTYIRSLAGDIGKEMNIPAMLTSLRRESIGKVSVPIETTQVKREDIIPFKFIDLSIDLMNDLLNGKTINYNSIEEDIISTDGNRTIWIKKIENNKFKIHKNIE